MTQAILPQIFEPLLNETSIIAGVIALMLFALGFIIKKRKK